MVHCGQKTCSQNKADLMASASQREEIPRKPQAGQKAESPLCSRPPLWGGGGSLALKPPAPLSQGGARSWALRKTLGPAEPKRPGGWLGHDRHSGVQLRSAGGSEGTAVQRREREGGCGKPEESKRKAEHHHLMVCIGPESTFRGEPAVLLLPIAQEPGLRSCGPA